MIPNLGYILLIAALALSFTHLFLSAKYIKLNSIVIFSCTLLSFLCLVYSYASSDFSVLNVYNNSHTLKPLLYKITGTWGNHEGSMLLLVLIFAAYNLSFDLLAKPGGEYTPLISKIQSIIIAGFYSFLIFTSNPFERLYPAPENGIGLNPLLQDIGLAIHPPLLYVGYAGLSLGLAYCVASLIKGEITKNCALSLKKYVLFSWSFLTIGIAMGSWWAYRELGWGGFWFWDPVENASLMPWLATTAFLHSLIVTQKRNELKIWTVLLGILTFSLSLLGIFLVRSGILTSVHSFAADPSRGVFILIFLGFVVNSSLLVFALRASKLSSANQFALKSKEGAILINNLLLCTACFTVIVGTLYPLILDIISDVKVSVGAPFFNGTFNPIAVPLLILAAIAPAIKWGNHPDKSVQLLSYLPPAIGFVVAILVYILPETKSLIASLALGASTWLICAMLLIFYRKYQKSGKISYSFIAMVLAHIGVAVLAIGITISTIWGTEKEEIIKIGESINISSFDVKMTQMFFGAENNYMLRQGHFSATDGNKELAVLKPEVRYYPVEKSNTTESAIYYSLLSNLYVAMGESDSKGGFVVRVYYKPAINLIWLGAFIMFASGLLAMFERRKKR